MSSYKVVKHPTLGYQAIKQGFNIFAFLFSFIWAAFKGLWQKALLLFIVILVLVSFENGIRLEGSETGLILTILVQLAFVIYVGRNANHWRVQEVSSQNIGLNIQHIGYKAGTKHKMLLNPASWLCAPKALLLQLKSPALV